MSTYYGDMVRLDWLAQQGCVIGFDDRTKLTTIRDSASGDLLGSGKDLRTAIDDAMEGERGDDCPDPPAAA